MGKTNRALHIDRENKKFLGVCAGIAKFLDVEAWQVRLVFLGSIFFGAWFLLPLYFGFWFCLDDSSTGVRQSLAENHAIKHFKNVDYKKKIYRNKREGKISGVCAGIADYLEVNVFAVRMCFLMMIFLTAFPILLYIGAVFVLDDKPETSHVNMRSRASEASGTERNFSSESFGIKENLSTREKAEYQEFEKGSFSKRREFQYCARKFANLQERLVRLEAYVTSSRFKLYREFKNIS
jgi:phage shock protein C